MLSPSTTLLVVLRNPTSRAARRWRDLQRRPDYARGASFSAKILAEAVSLTHCFESADPAERALSTGAWEGCIATLCGFRSCIMGSGVYAPQLSAWLKAASGFRWVILPGEALHAEAAESGLRRIFQAFPTLVAQQLLANIKCLVSDLGERIAALNVSVNQLPDVVAVEPTEKLLRAFFMRYNAPLRRLVQEMDRASGRLWQRAQWLPRPQEAISLAGPQGLRLLKHAIGDLRSALQVHGESNPDSSGLGSARWLGPSPRPTVFLIGARESSAESVSDLLLAQQGWCGGPLHLFDDDSRYMGGVPASTQRIVRRAMGMSLPSAALNATTLNLLRQHSNSTAACSVFVDTTSYLHSRWAPHRIHATIPGEKQLRFVAVLRDPIERVVLHWRSLNAALSRPQARKWQKNVAGGERGKGFALVEVGSYINGSTLARKILGESQMMQRCLNARLAPGSQLTSVRDWIHCTTVACSWFECMLGVGLYAPQLRSWLQHFDARQILLFERTQLSVEPKHVARQLQTHLGLNKINEVELLHARDNSSAPIFYGVEVRLQLQHFYFEHNQETRQLFETLANPGAWERVPWLAQTPYNITNRTKIAQDIAQLLRNSTQFLPRETAAIQQSRFTRRR